MQCPAVCDFDFATPCLAHKDCRVVQRSSQCVGEVSCSVDCSFAASCTNVTRDPGRIFFAKEEGELDFLFVHATFRNQLNVRADGAPFHIVLSNENGVIFTGQLPSGILAGNARGTRYRFKNKLLGRGENSDPGVAVVKLKKKKKKSEGHQSYSFKVKAYGDLSAATLPRMVTQVGIANEVAVIRGEWTKIRKGWRLYDRDLD